MIFYVLQTKGKKSLLIAYVNWRNTAKQHTSHFVASLQNCTHVQMHSSRLVNTMQKRILMHPCVVTPWLLLCCILSMYAQNVWTVLHCMIPVLLGSIIYNVCEIDLNILHTMTERYTVGAGNVCPYESVKCDKSCKAHGVVGWPNSELDLLCSPETPHPADTELVNLMDRWLQLIVRLRAQS